MLCWWGARRLLGAGLWCAHTNTPTHRHTKHTEPASTPRTLNQHTAPTTPPSLLSHKFGADAFGLHHRCYLHLDGQDNFWLSAEDGCEGKVAQPRPKFRMPFF